MLKRGSGLEFKTLGCALAGALLGGTLWLFLPAAAPDARAEGRAQPTPRAFLSGGERSEIILREIAETLRRIDGRLERLEKAVFEAGDPAAAPGGDGSASAAPAAAAAPGAQEP